ncbi:MAG: hypothetical protein KAJ62_15165 [Desulfobacteraceae bacterium]|nr:hypothetical protein [Desulfobacteraceae bacterium]
MKKVWEKPVTTIIAKSTTEENVLATCKFFVDLPYEQTGPAAPGCHAGTDNPDTSAPNDPYVCKTGSGS